MDNSTDLKLEVVVLPVSDVERSISFYDSLGWRLDANFTVGDTFRAAQFTPPGSLCSIHFGKGITDAVPGSGGPLLLVVDDIEATRQAILDVGVEVSPVSHRSGPGAPSKPGVHPERQSYSSYATFGDPDGNKWVLQEVTSRLPGRTNTGSVYFASPDAVQRAAKAHGVHELATGNGRDEDWAKWYANFLVAEEKDGPLSD